MIRKHETRIRGWAELLVRLQPCDHLTAEAIDIADYGRLGGLLPLAEFEKPFEILVHYAGPNGGLARRLARHDVINICTTAPSYGVTTLVVVDLEADQQLFYPGLKAHYDPEQLALALIPLRVALPFDTHGNN